MNFGHVTPSTIDHRTWRTGLPVRSAALKPCAGRLVVGWVTTSEYRLLIVFVLWPFFLGEWERRGTVGQFAFVVGDIAEAVYSQVVGQCGVT